MKRKVMVGYAALLLALVISTCGAPPTPAPLDMNSPDPQFPEFVHVSEMSLKAYRTAVRMPEGWMRSLPCYCNCGPTLGHRSLYDCFMNGDGTFTDHAATCSVCDMEVLDAAKWRAEGKTLKQVRRMIDTNYGAYGTGTKTAAVP